MKTSILRKLSGTSSISAILLCVMFALSTAMFTSCDDATEQSGPGCKNCDTNGEEVIDIDYIATADTSGNSNTGNIDVIGVVTCVVDGKETFKEEHPFTVAISMSHTPSEWWLTERLTGFTTVNAGEPTVSGQTTTSYSKWSFGQDKDGKDMIISAQSGYMVLVKIPTCQGDTTLRYGVVKRELIGYRDVKVYDQITAFNQLWTPIDRMFIVRYHLCSPLADGITTYVDRYEIFKNYEPGKYIPCDKEIIKLYEKTASLLCDQDSARYVITIDYKNDPSQDSTIVAPYKVTLTTPSSIKIFSMTNYGSVDPTTSTDAGNYSWKGIAIGQTNQAYNVSFGQDSYPISAIFPTSARFSMGTESTPLTTWTPTISVEAVVTNSTPTLQTVNGVSYEVFAATFVHTVKISTCTYTYNVPGEIWIKKGSSTKIITWKESKIDCGTASVKVYENDTYKDTYNGTWGYGGTYHTPASTLLPNFTLGTATYSKASGTFTAGSWPSGTGVLKNNFNGGSFTATFPFGGYSQTMSINIWAEALKAVYDANNSHPWAYPVSWEISSPSVVKGSETETTVDAILSVSLKVTLSNNQTCEKVITVSRPYHKEKDEIITWEWRNKRNECATGGRNSYMELWKSTNGSAFVKFNDYTKFSAFSAGTSLVPTVDVDELTISIIGTPVHNGASANGNSFSGSFTFNTTRGSRVFPYSFEEGQQSDQGQTGDYDKIVKVTIENYSEIERVSTQTASGYSFKILGIAGTVRFHFADGTSCTADGESAFDGRKKDKVISNKGFAQAYGFVTFDNTAQHSPGFIYKYTDANGKFIGMVGYIGTINGEAKYVGHWSADEADIPATTVLVKKDGSGAYIPAKTLPQQKHLVYYPTLKSMGADATHMVHETHTTVNGTFKSLASGMVVIPTYDGNTVKCSIAYQYTDKNSHKNGGCKVSGDDEYPY